MIAILENEHRRIFPPRFNDRLFLKLRCPHYLKDKISSKTKNFLHLQKFLSISQSDFLPGSFALLLENLLDHFWIEIQFLASKNRIHSLK